MCSVIRSHPGGCALATWWMSASLDAHTKPGCRFSVAAGTTRPDGVRSNLVSMASPSTTRNAQLEPTAIAHSLGINLEEFHFLVNQVRGISMVNLDELRSGGDPDQPAYGDIFEDVKSENPFASLKSRELRQSVAECISALPEKERLVISLYYYEDLNMKEIGNVLGITESRVCQIHTKAVQRLRSKLRSVLHQ